MLIISVSVVRVNVVTEEHFGNYAEKHDHELILCTMYMRLHKRCPTFLSVLVKYDRIRIEIRVKARVMIGAGLY